MSNKKMKFKPGDLIMCWEHYGFIYKIVLPNEDDPPYYKGCYYVLWLGNNKLKNKIFDVTSSMEVNSVKIA